MLVSKALKGKSGCLDTHGEKKLIFLTRSADFAQTSITFVSSDLQRFIVQY